MEGAVYRSFETFGIAQFDIFFALSEFLALVFVDKKRDGNKSQVARTHTKTGDDWNRG